MTTELAAKYFKSTRYPTDDELEILKAMADEGCSAFMIGKAVRARHPLVNRWARENGITIRKGNRKREFTERETQTLIELVGQGLGKSEIMKRMGIFSHVMNRELEKLNLAPVRQSPVPIVLNSLQRERIKRLFNAGHKISEIAERVGISRHTLPTKIKEMGLSRPVRAAHYQREITKDEARQLKEFIATGKTQTFICKSLKVRPPMLKRWLNDLDLTLDLNNIPPFSPTLDQKVIIDKMVAECKSMRQIAATLGISRTTMSNYFRRNDIERPRVAHNRPRKAKKRSVSAPPKAKPKSNPAPRTPKPKPAREITEKEMGLPSGQQFVSLREKFRLLGQDVGAELIIRRA
jgi:DNA invertase Pin-like site-specific DNA recombinase